MALTDYEKALIRDALKVEIELGDEELSISALKELAKAIGNIISNPKKPNSVCDTFQQMFNYPKKIITTTDLRKCRPKDVQRPTNGDVRKHMLACIDSIITNTCKSQQFNDEAIAWNYEELLGLVVEMPQNNVEIPSPQKSISEETEQETQRVSEQLLQVVSWLINGGHSITMAIEACQGQEAQNFTSTLINPQNAESREGEASVRRLRQDSTGDERQEQDDQISGVLLLLAFRNPQNRERARSTIRLRDDSTENTTTNKRARAQGPS